MGQLVAGDLLGELLDPVDLNGTACPPVTVPWASLPVVRFAARPWPLTA